MTTYLPLRVSCRPSTRDPETVRVFPGHMPPAPVGGRGLTPLCGVPKGAAFPNRERNGGKR